MLSRSPRANVWQPAQPLLLVSALVALSALACASTDDQANFSDMTGILQTGGAAGSAGSDPAAGTSGASTGGASSGGSTAIGGSGGSTTGGSATVGTGGSAGVATGGSNFGGASGSGSDGGSANGGTTGGSGGEPNQGGTDNGGSGGSGVCEPTGPERCDGIDNNCEAGIEDEQCPDNCVGVARGDHGYMFCKDRFAASSHDDAEDFCKFRGMELVSIETHDENDFLVETALDVGLDHWVWIGANDGDGDAEGEWFWVTGEQFWSGEANGDAVGDTQPNWDVGRPNNDAPDEDCAVLQLEDGFWNDLPCTFDMGNDFICEL